MSNISRTIKPAPTSYQTYLQTLGEGYFHPQVSTRWTGKNLDPSCTITASDNSFLGVFNKCGLLTFFDDAKFLSAFSSNTMFSSSVNESNIKVLRKDTNTYVTYTSSINASDIVDINVSQVLNTAANSSGAMLNTILTELSGLCAYDFNAFNEQTVPSYELRAAGTDFKIKSVRMNILQKDSSKNLIYEKYLANLDVMNSVSGMEDLRNNTNFYVFRRLMWLVRTMIHYQILQALSIRLGTPNTDYKNNLITNGVLYNAVNDFTDPSAPYNFGNFLSDTNFMMVRYYSNMNDLQDAYQKFKREKTDVRAEKEKSPGVDKFTKLSLALMIVILVLAVSVFGALGFAFTKYKTDTTKKFTFSIQVLLVLILVATVYYFVTRRYQLEPFNSGSMIGGSADDILSGFNKMNTLQWEIVQTSVLNDKLYAYLDQTNTAGMAQQTNYIYSAMTNVQDREINTLGVNKNILQTAKSEINLANKIIEARQRNYVMISWYVLAMGILAAFTLILHSLMSSVPLFQPIVLFVAGAVAFFFSIIVFVQVYSRTRRDPSKYYFNKPAYNNYA